MCITQKEILKGNKLIAEYIGEQLLDTLFYRIGTKLYEIAALNYHASMDWLIPVINKIKKTEQFAIISNNNDKWEISIETTGYHYVTQVYQINESLIEGCWLACIEYIEKFNNGTLKQSKK